MLPEKKRNLKEERQFKWGMVGIPIVVICMCGFVMGLCFYRHSWFGGLFQILPLTVNFVTLRRNLKTMKDRRNITRLQGLKDSSVRAAISSRRKDIYPLRKK